MDPVTAYAKPGQNFNRYWYANNNPYTNVDPDGRVAGVASKFIKVIFRGGDVAGTFAGAVQDAGVVFGSGATVGQRIGAAASLASEVFSPVSGRDIKAGYRAISGGNNASDVAKTAGRSGNQARLRELANDDKLGSGDRGWIKQEMNSIERGQRKNIRNPPGKDLAHERGREAAKGYGYEHSNLQDRDLHRLQHKYDNFGRNNKERPPQ